jgi:dethiobiotin synthetase
MLLRAWTGVADPIEDICPFAFAAPLAPLVAARLENATVDLDAVVDHVRRLAARHDALVVEGAGGLVVPVGDGWTIGELAARLALPAVVVARAGLGTVNHSILTVLAARRLGIEVLGVVLNGDDEGADENARMIERFGDVDVLGRVPRLPDGPTRESLRGAGAGVDVARVAAALRREELTIRP